MYPSTILLGSIEMNNPPRPPYIAVYLMYRLKVDVSKVEL